MTLDEWVSLAQSQAADNLHAFNFTREQSYNLSSLEPAYEAFETFLADKPFDPSQDANALLRDFVIAEAERVETSGPPDPRFADPGLRNDSRQVFLKSFGTLEVYLDRIGFDPAIVALTRAEIEAAIDTLDIDDPLEERLQAYVERLRPEAPSDAELEAIASLALAGSASVAPNTDDYGYAPWWFTYEDALADEEDKLDDRSLPLLRSGYVAGLRAGLGLYHYMDAHDEPTFLSLSGMHYRMYFQLAVTTPNDLAQHFNQPRLFSQGIPDLFLTNPKTPSGGKTIRLQEVGCAHKSCECAQDGLPEGVVPAYVPMHDYCAREVRGVYLALHRDLARYRPPGCDLIRSGRSAA